MSSKIADSEMSSILLCNIIKNGHYASKIMPYLDENYFSDNTERMITKTLIDFYNKYSNVPSSNEIVAHMKENNWVRDLDKNIVNDVLGDGYIITSQEWLVENTERFIRRRRVSLAFESTYGDFEAGESVDDFANVFQEAISFQFDNSVGHSLVTDADTRYDLYTSDEDRVSLQLEMLDLITSGGVPMGTLNCFLAGTGVGKSMIMCSMAAMMGMAGKKILYISLEMAELRLAERLECNLMDVPLKDMKNMSREAFSAKQQAYIEQLKSCGGDVFFKQYPTSSAHAGHFRNLLIEYKNKLGITFDCIFIDYLNICSTARGTAGDNSYTKVKNIAEELRALAIEFEVPIITATQTNRGGQSTTSLDFEDVSESHGLAATLDLLIGLVSTEEWEEVGKMMCIQIKNRYGDTNFFKKFMVGVDRKKMRFYNLKMEATNEVNQGKSTVDPSVATSKLDLSVLGIKSPAKSGLGGLKL